MKLLILNGPNLNLLGIREPALYGQRDYAALEAFVRECCRDRGAECDVFQSNHEGVLVETIQQALGVYDGIVLNAAAYTHTSVAILDALKAVEIPTVEVHLTDISAREPFRRQSYVALASLRCFAGKGFESYREAIFWLTDYLKEQ